MMSKGPDDSPEKNVIQEMKTPVLEPEHETINLKSSEAESTIESAKADAATIEFGISAAPTSATTAAPTSDEQIEAGWKPALPVDALRSHPLMFKWGASISILLILVMVAGWFLQERVSSEKSYRLYVDRAQLSEYSENLNRAHFYWKKAIDAAQKLGDSPKQRADLYKRASGNKKWLPSGVSAEKLEDIELLTHALDLYAQAPNCRPQQIWTIEALIGLYRSLQPYSQRADRQQWLADSLQERIKKGNLRIAIEYALEYTRQEHSVEHTLDQIVQIQKLLPNKDNLLERLLPLCHDSVILSRDSYLNLRIAQENLDSLIGKMGQDPNNFQDRLMLADNSFANKNWHGAVVEYARCLGIHEDAAVQAKLLSARKLSKNVDQPDNSLLEKQIDLTIRDLKLKTEAFGSDSGQAMNDRQNLGRLYLNNEELPKAEALLTQVANWSLKSKPQTATVAANPYGPAPVGTPFVACCQLAMVYGAEGKFRQADDALQKAWRFCGDAIAYDTETREIQLSLLQASILSWAGRYKEADTALERCGKPVNQVTKGGYHWENPLYQKNEFNGIFLYQIR